MQLQQKFSASMIEKLKSYKRRPKKYTKATQQRLDVAKRLFTMFDKDRSGYLTEDEIPDILIETYKEMGQNFNPSKDDIRSWVLAANNSDAYF
jgi:Ca2+-binding EF-hand superfamily protein